MNHSDNRNPDGLPSTQRLVKATLAALAAALIILLTTVLPAEYGLDPTGLGNTLGLQLLNQANAANTDRAAPQPASPDPVEAAADLDRQGPVWKGSAAPRTDTLTLTLQPRQGAEIKSKMAAGDNFVFGWQVAGGTVVFDMHGEPPNAGNAFTSYWTGTNQSEASGAFRAPFAGTHGWYWENTGDRPVTITLTTSGFYAGLYMP